MASLIYTGENRGVKLPTGERVSRAESSLSDFITRAEEIKYKSFKDNEQEFLKNSTIDPAFFISTANQQAQAKMLDEFNNTWAGEYKKYQGNMPMEVKQKMVAAKNLLLAQQQKMQSDQDLWAQHRTLVTQNPTKFDTDEWAHADADYRQTGEYKLTMPPIRAKSLDMALEDNPVIGNEILGEPIPETRGGVKGFYEQTTSGTMEAAKQRVRDLALVDPAYTKDLIRQFTALPLEQKLPYLTYTNSYGKIDESDRGDENAIIKWAQETKWQKALKNTKGAWRAVPGQTSTAKPATDITSLVGQKRDIDPKYGNVSRPNIYSLGGKLVLTDVPTKGAKLLDDQGSYDYETKGNLARAILKDYDVDKKTIIVQVTATDPTSGIATQQLVEIPQENIPNWQNIKINLNGKETPIGALQGDATGKSGELNDL